MINEILYLLYVLVGSIIVMARLGFLRRLLPKSLARKILAKLDGLKVSAPNLKSTADSNNSTSR